LIAKAAAILSATILLSGCGNQKSLLQPIKRAPLKQPTPGPVVPPSEWRAELHDAYRLRPDVRFLLAFGEIDRLAGSLPAPAGKAATAEFAGGRWSVHFGDGKAGSLPEFPDFPDYLSLLVAHAKAVIPRGTASPASRSSGGGPDSFLMPGLLKEIEAAERSLEKDRSFRDAAHCFARLAFQMPDRLELAPLIPARALALLAATRARDAHAGVEEVLLAHALGYTRHAETVAAGLPADAPLRAFEALDERALSQMASKPGASEEVRYFAVKRATSGGDLARWKEARDRFMPGNDSVAVIATGLEIELPGQVEVTERRNLLGEALPRAVLRELARMPSATPPGFESRSEFDTRLKGAVDAAKGALWDGAALKAYYEAAHYAPFETDRWPPWTITATTGIGATLKELSREDRTIPPDPKGDTRGAAVVVQRMRDRYQKAPPAAPQAFVEIRALVPWLDSRPAHRSVLAHYSSRHLQDSRAAEDLYRSLAQVLGDGSRKAKAESALYLGDRETLHRLLGSPDLTAPEATGILWSWYLSKVEPEQLAVEFERAIERFPTDWNATSYYFDLLRDRKEYRKACEVGERWLSRNTDPRTPGHFHAHIRLAGNYVLAHEYEKGRRLLEGMSESERFQQGNRKRGIAACLAGLGRLPEAEAMAREAVGTLRGQSDAMRVLIRILWAEGKDVEAADLLVDRKSNLEQWEVCDALNKDFSEVFFDLPAERLMHAVDAIAKKPELSNYSTCVIRGFGNAGRWEDALRVADRLSPPGPERMDQLIILYGYMKSWKGREAAAAWLKEKIPPDQRNPLSMKALYTKNDDLLWDVIGTPNPNDHPEWVWLFRAVAFALRGSDTDPHRAELLAYYGRDDRDSYHVMGRYLVGLGSEADMFALAASSRSEVAYYFGVRAQSEKRFRDACEWYRVAAESREGTSPRSLALYTLGEWAGMRQGIWKLEAGGNEKK
jgi:hypothetical protein